MDKVSTFARISAKDYRYVYILVSWSEYYSDVRDELKRQADAFAADLGLEGLFVQAFDRREYEVAQEVIAKAWPDDIRERMEGDPEPIILIIQDDFAGFDPREHPWALIWLSDFENTPYDLRPLLATLARKTRKGEDVIGYLGQIAARSRVGALGKLTKYVELKPGIFGVALDVSAILVDLSARAETSARPTVGRVRGALASLGRRGTG